MAPLSQSQEERDKVYGRKRRNTSKTYNFEFILVQEKPAEEVRPDSSASVGGKSEAKLTNQFNFSERASQTYNNPYRVSWST